MWPKTRRATGVPAGMCSLTASVSTSLAMTMRRLPSRRLSIEPEASRMSSTAPPLRCGSLWRTTCSDPARAPLGRCWQPRGYSRPVAAASSRHGRRQSPSALVEQVGVVTAVDPRPVLHQILSREPGCAQRRPASRQPDRRCAAARVSKSSHTGAIPIGGGVGHHDDRLGAGPGCQGLRSRRQGPFGLARALLARVVVEDGLQDEGLAVPVPQQQVAAEGHEIRGVAARHHVFRVGDQRVVDHRQVGTDAGAGVPEEDHVARWLLDHQVVRPAGIDHRLEV